MQTTPGWSGVASHQINNAAQGGGGGGYEALVPDTAPLAWQATQDACATVSCFGLLQNRNEALSIC